MANDPDIVPTTKPTCAARDAATGRPCHGVPSIPCPKCLLVAYCGHECRERHWAKHKDFCSVYIVPKPQKTDSDMDDEPINISPWSCSAATDVLNLEKNEGRHFDDYLSLLFTGEAGLRHLIYSVDKLPETASPTLCVCINETTHFNLTRTFLALHLLFSHDHDPVLNAEAVIHMWYSARMPKALHNYVNSVARKHVIHTLDDISCYYGGDKLAESQSCRSHTSQENLSMDVELRRAEWMAIKKRLEESKVGFAESVAIRYLDTTRNTEPPQRLFARMTRARSTGLRKWHDDGLLLPYGHPRDGFDTLNSLFFMARSTYPIGATAEPLSEWPMEVLDYDYAAPNDVYGKMFFYLRDLLVRFQRRVAKIPVKLQLTCEPGGNLPEWLPSLRFRREFDRIEVGPFWDQHPFLTLVLFSRLLRHEDENPFATMLALTRDTVTHGMRCMQGDLESEKLDMCRPTDTVLDEYAPPVDSEDDPMKGNVVRRRIGLVLWRNWDKFASRFLSSPAHFGFESLMDPETTVEHRSIIQTGFLGLAVREKQIITRRWPNRLVHSKKDKPSLRDFNRWLSWPAMLPERWLEWKLCGESPEDEWRKWMKIAVSKPRLAVELALQDIVSGQKSDDETEDGFERDMGAVSLKDGGAPDYDPEATIDATVSVLERDLKGDEDDLIKDERKEDEPNKVEPKGVEMVQKGTGKKKSKKSKNKKK
ncbi:hypothetical protein TOPH_06313 [Tolypocladium ophioglossoides CBS 100239]|uniref:MYND-type domain-containing protein n=1 Tax=Tolypocladium ophioglossoides (strain CBS 100239) TaxID=1163406 RepID=A0A0L0N4K7_TOLOC|nr:hypothetical protein TOPH_06313 [Tolypocladium ophioglossoides CBS 100239]